VLLEGRGEDPAGLREALRHRLAREEEAGVLGALCAASGLGRDLVAVDALATQLAEGRREIQRQFAALGLGLIGDRRAVPGLRAASATARYAPGRMRGSAVALGLLGDEQVVPFLLAQLADAGRPRWSAPLGRHLDPDAGSPTLRDGSAGVLDRW